MSLSTRVSIGVWLVLLTGSIVSPMIDEIPAAPRAPARVPSFAGVGSGTHYWIDAATGHDRQPGTEDQPWGSLDRIETAELRAGDLVHVRPGVYHLDRNLLLEGIAGEPEAWIGIRGEGDVVLRNRANENVIDVVGCRYLFLEGLEITHDNQGAPYEAWQTIDGIKFKNTLSEFVSIVACSIHDLGGVGVASQAPEIRSISLYGCEIYTCFTGVYFGYYEDEPKNYAHDSWIARNFIHDCPPADLDGRGYGIQIKGGSSGNVIEDNVLAHVGGGDRAGIAVYHVSTNRGLEVARNVIRRNVVRAARHEGIYASEGAIIENNLIVDSGEVGIEVGPRMTGKWGTFYGNLTIRNNTILRVDAPTGRGIRLLDGAFTRPFQVTNNAIVVTGDDQFAVRAPTRFPGLFAGNQLHGGVIGQGLSTSKFRAGTGFLSTTWGEAGFATPRPDGPLDGSAIRKHAPLDDFDGASREHSTDAGALDAEAEWVPADDFKPILR